MITTDKAATCRDNVERCEAGRRLPRIVTTSWDDGDACDLKIAEMLHDRKLSGTFYIPITTHHGSRALGRNELKALCRTGFEIGGHGFSHRILPQCTKDVLVQEVEYCKQSLEDILGSEVSMFAYPRGRYSSTVVRSVKQAGYAGARTTEMLAQGLHYDPYKMPTTIHVFPHTKSDYLRNTARAADFGSAWKFITELWQAESWVELAKTLFDSILAEGGVFHLYGHSWEIDALGLWNDLEEILDYVSNRDNVLYLPNGDTLDYRTAKRYIHTQNHCASER
jgi:peptidoglycan-N-acetylglucosamine deacetylase